MAERINWIRGSSFGKGAVRFLRASLQDTRMRTNPVDPSKADVLAVYKAAFQGEDGQ